jgi:hypothetical protein
MTVALFRALGARPSLLEANLSQASDRAQELIRAVEALVGADLGAMERDGRRMRGSGPTVFAQVTRGPGVEAIAAQVVAAWKRASE